MCKKLKTKNENSYNNNQPLHHQKPNKLRHVENQNSNLQVHEGEQDIPRADALQFAREGGLLRRPRILHASNTLVHFKVFREYPANAAALPPPESRSAPEPSRQGGGGGGSGGLWVVEAGGKRQTLVGLRADASRRHGLLFSTKEDGEIEVACDDQESYRMWLGVAAAVCPAAAAGSIE